MGVLGKLFGGGEKSGAPQPPGGRSAGAVALGSPPQVLPPQMRLPITPKPGAPGGNRGNRSSLTTAWQGARRFTLFRKAEVAPAPAGKRGRVSMSEDPDDMDAEDPIAAALQRAAQRPPGSPLDDPPSTPDWASVEGNTHAGGSGRNSSVSSPRGGSPQTAETNGPPRVLPRFSLRGSPLTTPGAGSSNGAEAAAGNGGRPASGRLAGMQHNLTPRVNIPTETSEEVKARATKRAVQSAELAVEEMAYRKWWRTLYGNPIGLDGEIAKLRATKHAQARQFDFEVARKKKALEREQKMAQEQQRKVSP